MVLFSSVRVHAHTQAACGGQVARQGLGLAWCTQGAPQRAVPVGGDAVGHLAPEGRLWCWLVPQPGGAIGLPWGAWGHGWLGCLALQGSPGGAPAFQGCGQRQSPAAPPGRLADGAGRGGRVRAEGPGPLRPPCGASVSGINAQARRLQRSRAKGTPAPTSGGGRSPPPHRLRRTVSETSLSSATTVPDAARGPEEPGQDAMRCSLYESPHLLLLQGYSQQHVSTRPSSPRRARRGPAFGPVLDSGGGWGLPCFQNPLLVQTTGGGSRALRGGSLQPLVGSGLGLTWSQAPFLLEAQATSCCPGCLGIGSQASAWASCTSSVCRAAFSEGAHPTPRPLPAFRSAFVGGSLA